MRIFWMLSVALCAVMFLATPSFANDRLCNHLSSVNGSKKTPNKTTCAGSTKKLAKSYAAQWGPLKRCLMAAKTKTALNQCFDKSDAQIVGLTVSQLNSKTPQLPNAQAWCSKFQSLVKGAQKISNAQAKKLKKGCPQFFAWTQKRFGGLHGPFLRCSMSAKSLPRFDECQKRTLLRLWALGS